MALDKTQIAVELDMGGRKMVLWAIVMDNEVMDTINARTLKDRILDFLVQLGIRRRPEDIIHRLLHDAIAGPKDEEGHDDAHHGIDMPAEEIFHERRDKDTCRREHIRERVGAVGKEGIGGKPFAGSFIPPCQEELPDEAEDQNAGDKRREMGIFRMQDLLDGFFSKSNTNI